MKGSEATLVSYMQGADKRFIIPVYQRNYDWRIENCEQLYDDLVKIIRKGRSSHFFGSIVSVHSDGEFNECLIIDGQRRLNHGNWISIINAGSWRPASPLSITAAG